MSNKPWLPPEEYAEIAREQREWINELADTIEAGDRLTTSMDRTIAAGILRAWAKQIPDVAPRGPGQSPRFDSGQAAWEFALLVNVYGKSKNKAHEELAERFDVSPKAIRDALKKHPDALDLMPRNPNLKRK